MLFPSDGTGFAQTLWHPRRGVFKIDGYAGCHGHREELLGTHLAPIELSAWTQWADIIGGFAPAVTLLVVFVAYLAYRQKAKADKRSEWWKRAQWGIESSASENPNLQQMGANVMNHLSRSGLQTKEDASLIFETALVPSNDSLTDEFDASLVERAKQRDNEHEGRYKENTESANEGGEQHG